jgi:VanZ family protein
VNELGKKMLFFIWMGAIFLMTTVTVPNGKVTHYTNFFKWQAEPVMSEFLAPVPPLSEEFVLRKVGHILVFFLLSLLFVLAYQSIWNAFFICFLFGFLTEFVQLFFSRGGRLFDVWIDGVGVMVGLVGTHLMIQAIERVKSTSESLKG